MKKTYLFLLRVTLVVLLCSTTATTYSQSELPKKTAWVQEKFGDLLVSTPTTPEYKDVGGKGVYVCKTDNCYYTIVKLDGIPAQYYPTIMSQPDNDRKYYINRFINGVIEGILATAESKAVTSKAKTLSGFIGREISFYAINPVSGVKGLRYMATYYIPNEVYVINCFLLNKSQDCTKEKDRFFSSIRHVHE